MKFKYKCATCGKEHDGAPSFSFSEPAQFNRNAGILKKLFKKNYLDIDLCVSENSYYIRVILEIPIINTDEKFTWGVWVSQSKENFDYYKKHFTEDNSGRESFGWFSNILPYYQNTLNLKTNVKFQRQGVRPKIDIEKTEHELSKDFYNGISEEKAIKIAEIAMHQFVIKS